MEKSACVTGHPPILRAVRSCTTPRSGGPIFTGQRSVGAIRGTSEAGGWNMLSFMPSGRKIFSARIGGNHFSAQPVHQFAEQDEIDVAIDIPCGRRTAGPEGAGQFDAGVVAGPRCGQRHVRLQAREVCEQFRAK